MSGYRNKFEALCGKAFGPEYGYETLKLTYTTTHTYCVDFSTQDGKSIIEVKGYFPPSDRKKMLAVRKAYPDLDMEMCFQNPNAKISKTSSTTYKAWAEKNGFKVREAPKA